MRGVNRCAITLAILAMTVIMTGGFLTSTEVAARLAQTTFPVALDGQVHRFLGIAMAALMLGLGIWTFSMPRLRLLVWSATAILIVDAGLGWAAAPLAPARGVMHALLAHLFFASIVAIGVATSDSWNREPERVDGSIRPLLRPLALAIPPVVFLQITLGAMYRHDVTGIMPHMAIAMGVAFLALIGSSVILQNFPRPQSMRRAAAVLITAVLIQVCLGITSFLLIVLNAAGNPYFLMATVAHVAVGASTLAASVVMAMEVWRSVLPAKKAQRTS